MHKPLPLLLVVVIAMIGLTPTAQAAPGDPGEPLATSATVCCTPSPDSRHILYTITAGPDAVLYSRPMDGGRRVRLSPAGQDVEAYVISPDSNQVVYAAGTGLHRVRITGGGASVIDSGRVSKLVSSADGGTIVYAAGSQLWAVATVGGAPVRLDLTSTGWSAAITPDATTAVVWADPAGADQGGIFAVPLDGSARRLLAPAPDPASTGGRVLVSPDGGHAVVRIKQPGNQWELYSVALDGGGLARLNGDLPAGGDVKQFDVTPDSTTVVYRADQAADNVEELWAVPVDGGQARRLNRALPPGGDVKRGGIGSDGRPVAFIITPDSQRVVYRGDVRSDNVVELFTADLGGGPAQRLSHSMPSHSDVDRFALTSDGATVVFLADQHENDVKELYANTISFGPLTKLNGRLVRGGDVKAFLVSPDGTTVLYIADQDVNNQSEAYAAPIGGRRVTKLSGPMHPRGDAGGSLWWSPDSRWAGFAADDHANEHGHHRVAVR